jgi:hypothetical protein
MGRSVADLERMARVLFGERGGREDYFPAPVSYRDVTLPEKLRFGYYLNGTSSVSLINAVLMDMYIKQTVWSRDLLPATGLCWKPYMHFARQDMNASRSILRMVREEISF